MVGRSGLTSWLLFQCQTNILPCKSSKAVTSFHPSLCSFHPCTIHNLQQRYSASFFSHPFNNYDPWKLCRIAYSVIFLEKKTSFLMREKAKCRRIKLACNLCESITLGFNWNAAILFPTSREDYFTSLLQDEKRNRWELWRLPSFVIFCHTAVILRLCWTQLVKIWLGNIFSLFRQMRQQLALRVMKFFTFKHNMINTRSFSSWCL